MSRATTTWICGGSLLLLVLLGGRALGQAWLGIERAWSGGQVVTVEAELGTT